MPPDVFFFLCTVFEGRGTSACPEDVFATMATLRLHWSVFGIFRKKCRLNRNQEIGNASLFTKFLFTILVPLSPPPNQKVMDFPLSFY